MTNGESASPPWWAIALVLVACLGGPLWFVTRNTDPPPAPKVAAPCIIRMPSSSGPVIVFPTEGGHDESIKASAVGDTVGFSNAIQKHGGFAVEPGTTCQRLLESDHVRITSGAHNGSDVWLPQEFHGDVP